MSIGVAIAGVGNCASSLVQGVHYYAEEGEAPGLMHRSLGGYGLDDLEFVAAFDVGDTKVGRDLSDAIFAEPNCADRFHHVPELGVEVDRGPLLDGVGSCLGEEVEISGDEAADVEAVLEESGADVLVNFLPVGSHDATRRYAEAAVETGTAFVNCIPEFIASDPDWASRFDDAGVPVLGDDVKSQLGATILHRAVVQLMRDRGLTVDDTYQLNIGGNTDFKNMLEEERNATKRVSKTEAVTSVVDGDIGVRIGPSDYVEFLGDEKQAHIQIDGRNFGGEPVEVEMKLTVQDSPNSAGVVVDAIRGAKVALDRGASGPIEEVSAYLFKHPPLQVDDDEARERLESFFEEA